ncbi:hypothetical protein MMC20_006695 [Loxospora ochrophaea]|nr:hypothetical protein [Loxospora ochrophaea]
MDLVAGIRKEGSRGGRDSFKWDDVKADQHRENYLGHSLLAPVGRWQKNRDLSWYAKADSLSSDAAAAAAADREARADEIRRIKEAERDALSAALGFAVEPKGLVVPLQQGEEEEEEGEREMGKAEGEGERKGNGGFERRGERERRRNGTGAGVEVERGDIEGMRKRGIGRRRERMGEDDRGRGVHIGHENTESTTRGAVGGAIPRIDGTITITDMRSRKGG